MHCYEVKIGNTSYKAFFNPDQTDRRAMLNREPETGCLDG